jgi:hypothetical protein
MARGKGRRGGYQQPANPAPVSNPGSGARTDGGPGNARQPLRVASGQPHGARKASIEQQQGAPLAVGGSSLPTGTGPAGQSPGGPPVAGPPIPPQGVFGPSTNQTDPASMSTVQPNTQPLPAEVVLQVMYQKRPSPWLARLLENGQ